MLVMVDDGQLSQHGQNTAVRAGIKMISRHLPLAVSTTQYGN